MKKLGYIIPWIFVVYFIIALYGEKNENKGYKYILQIKNSKIDSLKIQNSTQKTTILYQRTTIETLEQEKEKVEMFWNSISFIESSNGKHTIGDSGRALGHLQIWNTTVIDVNRIYGTNYTHEQMFDECVAREFGTLYLNQGCQLYYKKYYKLPTKQTLARMWNGGIYGGYYNDKTLVYVDKFNKYYKEV